jgi:hypothetical protein
MSASVGGTRWYPSLRSANSPERVHRGVGHRAIVANDPQRVELGLERDVLGAAARGVEDLHPHDRGDPQPVVDDRCLKEGAELAGE